MPRRPQGLFLVLEKILKNTKEPLTCVDMWDFPEVREHAESVNRVSDYMGHLWRKGNARRSPAPKTENTAARYAYTWNSGSALSVATGKTLLPPSSASVESQRLLDRPELKITGEGDTITITLPKLSITIKLAT